MGKIALGPLIRHLITLLIGFFVARHMLSQDVANKLNAGDTVELWSGGWSVSIKQVVDFTLNAIVPALVPILWSIRVRLIERYRLIIARLSPTGTTHKEVKARAAKKSLPEIISIVASKP